MSIVYMYMKSSHLNNKTILENFNAFIEIVKSTSNLYILFLGLVFIIIGLYLNSCNNKKVEKLRVLN